MNKTWEEHLKQVEAVEMFSESLCDPLEKILPIQNCSKMAFENVHFISNNKI